MNPDLKLTHLTAFQAVSREPKASVSLGPVAQAYAQSITNLFTLSCLLPMVLQSAIFFERAESKALLEVTRSLERLKRDDPRHRCVQAHVTRQFAAKLATSQPMDPDFLDQGVEHLTHATTGPR